MKLLSIISRDLSTIFSHPYNNKNQLFAYLRYVFYLALRFFNINKIPIRAWGDRRLIWYKDSIQSNWFLFNYIIDWEEFCLIKHNLKKDSIFLDVGANIGYYSIWASKFITSGRIFSFEPNGQAFNRLIENIKINNRVHNITSINQAVSQKNGDIYMTNNLDTLNHILSTKEKIDFNSSVKVKSTTLDSFVDEYHIDFIDYLKIDVEGFELDVLLGAEKLFKEKRIGIVQLEINNALDHSSHTVISITDFFDRNNYCLCQFEVDTGNLRKIDYSQLRENYFVTSAINLILE
jgi:FkbM family methyltransferase